MGIRQVLHRLFTGETAADVTLARMVVDLGRRVEALEEQRIRDFESFRSFRGRVYADKRWTPPEEPSAPTDLNDPRLTKQQVKAALAARGALKPKDH